MPTNTLQSIPMHYSPPSTPSQCIAVHPSTPSQCIAVPPPPPPPPPPPHPNALQSTPPPHPNALQSTPPFHPNPAHLQIPLCCSAGSCSGNSIPGLPCGAAPSIPPLHGRHSHQNGKKGESQYPLQVCNHPPPHFPPLPPFLPPLPPSLSLTLLLPWPLIYVCAPPPRCVGLACVSLSCCLATIHYLRNWTATLFTANSNL